MTENPCLRQVERNLPRLLALIDRNRLSPGYGMADRFHWAWGLIDFGNGTFQGAAGGLALLWKAGLWPMATGRDVFLGRIDALFRGAGKLTRPDGSMEESFPREGSFCVTALAAFDLLCALRDLDGDAGSPALERWRETVRPMVGFLVRSRESHGFISNHLAAAFAALNRWHILTGEDRAREKAAGILRTLIAGQSPEGWFPEYGGADPGYLSMTVDYLADAHRLDPSWGLEEPLSRAVRFLWRFAHPDGSFGGIYGSRCTRFYDPAGIEALAGEMPEALCLAGHMSRAIAGNRTVTLDSMDETGLVPWFNAYCRAAAHRETRGERPPSGLTVPCLESSRERVRLPQAGILIDRGPGHYTIISTLKGGVITHFRAGRPALEDGGAAARDARGRTASTQSPEPGNEVRLEGDTLAVTARFRNIPLRLPGPLDFLLLRLLCLTFFRFRAPREAAKRLLVRFLITGGRRHRFRNTRTISLGPELSFRDEHSLPPGWKKIDRPGAFVPIHMAGQGYWQAGDEEAAW